MSHGTLILRATATLLVALVVGALTLLGSYVAEVQLLGTGNGILSWCLAIPAFLITLRQHHTLHRFRHLPRTLTVTGTVLLATGTGLLLWATLALARHVPRGPFDGIQYFFYQLLKLGMDFIGTVPLPD